MRQGTRRNSPPLEGGSPTLVSLEGGSPTLVSLEGALLVDAPQGCDNLGRVARVSGILGGAWGPPY